MQTLLYKACHEAVEPQVVDMTMSRVDSEVLLLSFLMMGLTVSVLVNKRYDCAQGQTAKGQLGIARPSVGRERH